MTKNRNGDNAMPTIHCPKCNQEYELDESIVGCSVQCAVCDTRFVAQYPKYPDDIQTPGDSGNVNVEEKNAEMPDRKKRKDRKRVFLIVLSMFLLICIVFAVIVISALNATFKDKKNTELAMTQIKLLYDAIQQYKFDVGYYPSNLQCLVENIDKVDKWNGPYIMPNVPRDPWDN